MAFAGPRIRDLSGATLLIGSALSGDKINALPSGMALSRLIIERLLGFAGMKADDIWEWAIDSPFEQLLNDHPDPDHVQTVIRKHYSVTNVNPYQAEVARLAGEKSIGAIITTNYDGCLERALTVAGVSHDALVAEHDKRRADHVPVFKIHGSADRTNVPLVMNLTQEGQLAPWKRQLLHELCNGKTVFVLGYSGRDFDICPTLLATDCKELFWLERETDPYRMSAHLRYAVQHPHAFPAFSLVTGEFEDILPVQHTYTRASNAQAVVDEIFEGAVSDPNSYQLWAARLFQAISCRRAAKRVLDGFVPKSPADRARALHLQSDLEERRGAYRTSVRTLERVRPLWEAEGHWDLAAKACIEKAWRLITGRYPIRFLWEWWRAGTYVRRLVRSGKTLDVSLAEARLAYLGILFCTLVKLLRAAPILHATPFKRRIVVAATQALEGFRLRGLWQEHYLMTKQLQDLGFGDALPRTERILPARFGFGQLGNLAGDASSFRREAKPDSHRAETILRGLLAYGLYPETWKFVTELSHAVPSLEGFAPEALDAFKMCEYGWLIGVINQEDLKRLRKQAGK